ncbi:hypothetical protein HDV06_006612 [Boothiomyces sp. JEL0866]|nr:hypothetical protein HDV06_006612 [Boothiomyces sp. JEL0866]
MKSYCLLACVAADYILETAWEEGDCSGQPSAMTLFPDTNTSHCGTYYNPLITGCCVSALDKNESFGFQSATYVKGQQITIDEYWSSANGHSFCKFGSENGSGLDWGYITRYLKPDGVCYDGVVCTNSQLSLYNSSDCSDSFQLFNLTYNQQHFFSLKYQRVILASIVHFSGGTATTMWTMFFPLTSVVPTFRYPLEIIGFTGYLLAFLLSLFAAYNELRKVLRKAKGAKYLLIGQILWTLWVILSFTDWNYIYPSVLLMEVIDSFLALLYNVSTLLSISATFSLVLNFFSVKGRRKRRTRFAVLLATHIVLAGGGYLYALGYIPELAYLFTYWYTLFPTWNLLLYLMNTIPPILILAKIGSIYGFMNDISSPITIFSHLIKKSPIMGILLPCQILNTITYIILIATIQYSDILKNDRNFLAWNGLISLCMIVHENFVNRLLLKVDKKKDKDFSLTNNTKVRTSLARTAEAFSNNVTLPNVSRHNNICLLYLFHILFNFIVELHHALFYMIRIIILSVVVTGNYILESVWEEGDCSGSPSIITLFTDTNVSALWSAWEDDYQYPYCGCDFVPLPTGCCISSIDLNASLGFQSSTYVVSSDNISMDEYWSGANNQFFCHYSDISSGAIDWGYIERYIKPNGICYDGFTCHSNQLFIYNTTDCSDVAQILLPDVIPAIYYVARFDSLIRADFKLISGAKAKTKWTAYYPAKILVPNFHSAGEVIGILSYSSGLLLSIYAVGLLVSKLIKNPKTTMLYFVGQLLWVAWIAIKIMDWTIKYQSYADYEIVEAVLYALYNISTLLSISATFSMMLNYFEIKDRSKRAVYFAILFALHLLLAGGGYFIILSYYASLELVFAYWYNLFPFWNVVLYSVNTIPYLAILGKIGYLYGYSREITSPVEIIKGLIRKSPVIGFMVPLQALNTIAYAAIISIVLYTHLLKNDRNALAMNGIVSFCMIVHEVLNYWIKEYIAQLAKSSDTNDDWSKNIAVFRILLVLLVEVKLKSYIIHFSMIQSLLITNIAFANIILESAWEKGDCNSQPSIITIFPDTNTSALWDTFQDEYYYPYCGCDYSNLYSGCCISSLDPNNSFGYQSATYVVQNDSISLKDFWKDANNQYFCVYSAADGGQLDWGYFKRFIKPNGICYDGFVCIKDTLLVYNNTGCIGQYQSVALDSKEVLAYIPLFRQHIYATFYWFDGGTVETVWTMFYPLVEVTPKFRYPLEVIGLACYICAWLLSLFACYKELCKVFKKIEGAIYLLIAQLLWIIWIVFCFADWTSSYSSVATMEIIDGLIPIIYNISSLLSMWATCGLILNFLNIRALVKRAAGYALVLASHIFLAGGGYIFVFCFIPEIAYIFTNWYKLFPIWNLLLFAVNTVPPMMILFKIGNLYAYTNEVRSPIIIYRNLMQKGPAMAVLLPLQLINTFTYVALVVIVQFTQLLNNDRNFMAWNGLIILSMIIHEVLNYWIKSFLTELLSKVGTKDNDTPDCKMTKMASSTVSKH